MRGLELHGQERRITRRITATKSLVEFDAVDNHRMFDPGLVGFEEHVLKAQIAMSIDGQAFALRKKRRAGTQELTGPIANLVEGLLVHEITDELLRIGEVLLQVCGQRRQRGGPGHGPRGPKKCRQVHRQRAEAARIQAIGEQQLVGVDLVRQATHSHHPVDRRTAFAGADQIVVSVVKNGEYAAVNVRGKPPVQLDLRLAIETAGLGLAEIQKAKVHGPLQFPHLPVGDEDPG
ncbi:MAG TPA: hypothetical protein VH374_21325 [Polyangia bacterium]|nr:hypothetical protein [Polyangia bacterium]